MFAGLSIIWRYIMGTVLVAALVTFSYLNLRLSYEKVKRQSAEEKVTNLEFNLAQLKEFAESEEVISTNEKVIIREVRNAPQKQYKAKIEPVLDGAIDAVDGLLKGYLSGASD